MSDEYKINTVYGLERVDSTKKCIKCNKIKHMSEFAYRSYRNGIHSEQRNDCKQCQSDLSKVVRHLKKDNPPPDFDTYKCPSCSRTKDDLKGWKTKPFVLEHSHKTGAFRGYVCQYCNHIIGHSNESIDVLKGVIRYLKRNDD